MTTSAGGTGALSSTTPEAHREPADQRRDSICRAATPAHRRRSAGDPETWSGSCRDDSAVTG